jgi:hypothetical protein
VCELLRAKPVEVSEIHNIVADLQLLLLPLLLLLFVPQEHLFLVCELLRANLYEFQKYQRENGDEPYFTPPRIQRIATQVRPHTAHVRHFILYLDMGCCIDGLSNTIVWRACVHCCTATKTYFTLPRIQGSATQVRPESGLCAVLQ